MKVRLLCQQTVCGVLLCVAVACGNNQNDPALLGDSALPDKDPAIKPATNSTPTPPASLAAIPFAKIQTVDEPAGSHCKAGGKAVRSWTEKGGSPDIYDETIDSALSVSYLCNGEKGESTVVVPSIALDWSVEPPGAHCVTGGNKYRPFVDNGEGNGTANDGLKNGQEAYLADSVWEYVCQGANGANGANGTNGVNGSNGRSLGIDWGDENPGSHCTSGGKKFRPFVDDGSGGGTANDGMKNGGELYAPVDWQYLCHGSQGTPGTNGTNGTNGSNGTNGTTGIDGQSVGVEWGAEPAGSNCSQGGSKYRVFIDNGTGGGTANDGTKNGTESYAVGSLWQYVCHGVDGQSVALEILDEPMGANCAAGGKKIRPFIDNGLSGGTAHDGSKNGGEDYVIGSSPQFVCNGTNGGMDGAAVGLDWATEAPGAHCAQGGKKFMPFIDNGAGGGAPNDGTKNGTEAYVFPSTWLYVCNGALGIDGQSVALTWNPEPAGTNCTNGGIGYRAFLDNGSGGGIANDGTKNGTEEFVAGSTWQYVCNGTHGQSIGIDWAMESAGANCTAGGRKYRPFLDNGNGGGTANDGSKNGSEVYVSGASWQYVCNGTNGTNGTNGANGTNGVDGQSINMNLVPEPSGTNCTAGGIKLRPFIDDGAGGGTAHDGVVNGSEVYLTGTTWQFVCNGTNGTNGSNGTNGTNATSVALDIQSEPSGANCTNGGKKFMPFVDNGVGGGTPNDGSKNGTEAYVSGASWQYVCNGTNGTNGTNGANGTNGTNGLTVGMDVQAESAGANCTNGGKKFMPFVDNGAGGGTPNDGSKNGTEAYVVGATWQYVCNGINGTVGASATRNLIINGDMRIDQRRNGSSSTANDYIVDRFFVWKSGAGVMTAQQSTVAPPEFSHSLSVTATTPSGTINASDYYMLGTKIEGYDVAPLRFGTTAAQTFTVSFWVRSSVAGTYPLSFRNNGSLRSFVTTYTISQANTWEKKTVTVPGDISGIWDATNQIGIVLAWGLGAGSSYTTSSLNSWVAGNYLSSASVANWAATSGATFYLTGVQMEAGSQATPFEFRPYSEELLRAQRYYYSTTYNLAGWTNVAQYPKLYSTLPTTMRANPAPTITAISSQSGLSATPGDYAFEAYTTSFSLRCMVYTGAGGGATVYSNGTITLFAEL